MAAADVTQSADNDILSDDEWVWAVNDAPDSHHVNTLHDKQPKIMVTIGGVKTPVLLEVG